MHYCDALVTIFFKPKQKLYCLPMFTFFFSFSKVFAWINTFKKMLSLCFITCFITWLINTTAKESKKGITQASRFTHLQKVILVNCLCGMVQQWFAKNKMLHYVTFYSSTITEKLNGLSFCAKGCSSGLQKNIFLMQIEKNQARIKLDCHTSGPRVPLSFTPASLVHKISYKI